MKGGKFDGPTLTPGLGPAHEQRLQVLKPAKDLLAWNFSLLHCSSVSPPTASLLPPNFLYLYLNRETYDHRVIDLWRRTTLSLCS
jgi:hypothetical protein